MSAIEQPVAKLDGLTFFPVPEFDAPTVAFGADEGAFFHRGKLPKVPRQWEDFAQNLMFKGGALPELAPEVDRIKANNAVRAWLTSWAPAHEAKITTVGYALWLWTSMKEPRP